MTYTPRGIFLTIYLILYSIQICPKEVYADDIYSIIIITDKLASAFLDLEDYGNASNYHTLNAMDSIIIDCYHQKNYAQAKELAFEAYIKRKEVLGPEHDKTLISQQQYLDLLDKI